MFIRQYMRVILPMHTSETDVWDYFCLEKHPPARHVPKIGARNMHHALTHRRLCLTQNILSIEGCNSTLINLR